MSVPPLHVLRVFTTSGGEGGNPLGVFLDGAAVPPADRQALAAELGFSETVFVDDAVTGTVRIYTPGTELPMAGHPLVGTSWLLARERAPVDVLRPPAGEVPTWSEDGVVWIRGRPEWAPDFVLREAESAREVEDLPGPPPGEGLIDVWAWIDEPAGVVRSRVFPVDLGIEEDEATGAAALRLGAHLARPIEIHQGRGSELRARPGPSGTIEVGGRTTLDEVRGRTLH